ncbi:Oxysterol-binding protein-like protein 1 [Zancudomyces culisetae]|uniref:Oxysterol-binding protein-like protein 1 n=1 Tax=Zancudomyces culisetae TaxID=1213189 RepID=A0A1R1PHB5_ZANCU|nr:Oxysterol-binding protein-like protein 1 [Zancudomyces culisetae]|eukprot:OMH80364.1 Oxysterol-binding protein-like protein 1 [Zancudomyces culisetae]
MKAEAKEFGKDDEFGMIIEHELEEQNPKKPSTSNDSSRIFTLLGIMRKFIGVKDLLNLRVSLPTQILDPISNLEYWGYVDAPEFFTCIPDSDDPLERMISTVRWWIAKDLKFTKYKILKPFNSVLGEQFFCKWVVERDIEKDLLGNDVLSNGDDDSNEATNKKMLPTKVGNVSEEDTDKPIIEYITEQVSHHPPVSAFMYRCQKKKMQAVGFDHLAAKFTGLSVTISPGTWAKGIFLTLFSRNDELYECKHSNAAISGWLTGSIKVNCIGKFVIKCKATGLAAIVEVSSKNWFGMTNDVLNGVVVSCDPINDRIDNWSVKEAMQNGVVLATIEGNWSKKCFVTRLSTKKKVLLVDMSSIVPTPKIVKPIEEQGEVESRRVWGDVISKMLEKDYSAATKFKTKIEEHQRKLAATRKETGEEFVPKLFAKKFDDGMPVLLPDAPINL